MPLTFVEAYKIVKPNGGEAKPGSKDFRDIMELMRQSGYVPLQDNLITENVPRVPQTVQEAKRYVERPVSTKPLYVSKKEWLSVQSNKDAFLKHLK